MAVKNFLEYETTLDGRPKKLRLNCETKYMAGVLNIAGARRQKDNSITLPPDPFNAEQLLKYIKDLELGEMAENWYNRYLEKREKLAKIKEQKRSEKVQANSDKLYNYQSVDVEFLKEGKRTIEASEMGTGKTVIAISNAVETGAENILIVAPKSVLYNWEKEIKLWDKNCGNVVVTDGSRKQRTELLKQPGKYKLINYAMLRNNKYPYLFEQEWDLVIFDEAHRLKGRNTAQSEGAENLQAKNINMLTGSPIPNHPHELWHLLHILYPRRFSSYWQFVDRFCVTEENFFSPTPDIVGVKNEKYLKEILTPIMIRNKKENVLSDLPPKTYQEIELELEKKQRRIYDGMEEDMLTFINGEAHKISNSLGKLIRLQQITLSPKILDSEYKGKGIKTKALLDLLEDTDKKVVVFSWFKTYIEILDEELQKAGYKTAVVTGGKSSEERGKAEKDFWEDPEVKVFLGTIGSAGEGMNLQVADTLIFMDKSWTPAQNRQAEDRIHRVGQKGNATIISFVAKNTIDVDKEITLANKEQVISKVMSMENTAKNLLARTAGNM